MKKFLTILLVTGYGLLVTFSASASIATPTRDYLRSTTQTDWITMARVAGGDVGVTTDHLRSSPGSEATDYERRILAIVAAGENPTSFAGTNWVIRLGDFFDGNQIGAVGLLNDDAWGILAFRAAGISSNDKRVTAPRDVLLQNQNNDGGWGFARQAASDTNDTAIVIQALLEAGISVNDARLVRGFNYLKQAQRNDGGVGFTTSNDSDTASTAWTMTAFTKAGYTAEANRAAGWLENQRRGDGSYRWRAQDTDGTPLMTAYAAIATAPTFFPVRSFTVVPTNNQTGARVIVDYRIEGGNSTLCQGAVLAATPLDLLEQVTGRCGLNLDIINSGFGRYVRGINGETAHGEVGWLYRVNGARPDIGAADYRLMAGDQVVWYFGRFDSLPPERAPRPVPPVPAPLPIDSDLDGLSDAEERRLGTNPRLADTDGDGYTDLMEVRSGYDPRSWVPCKVRQSKHTAAQRQAIDQCWTAYTVRPVGERSITPRLTPTVRIVPDTKPATGGTVRVRVIKHNPVVTKPPKMVITIKKSK